MNPAWWKPGGNLPPGFHHAGNYLILSLGAVYP
jgi:hypothetical protein